MIKHIRTPLDDSTIADLSAGDTVEISGTLYTARDQAHKRLVEAIEKEEPLPFDLSGKVIFYAGPAPAPPGKASGSIGPTTSARMDVFTPQLLAHGVKGVIGKGPRSPEVVAALQRHHAVYFAATGGVAALLASYVKSTELIAYPDLGPEAVYRLEVERFPVIVAVDARGADVYKENRDIYRRA